MLKNIVITKIHNTPIYTKRTKKKLEAILVVHDMRLFEKKKIFASKKNDF